MRKTTIGNRSFNSGMSIIEVLVSMAIFSIGILALVTAQISNLKTQNATYYKTVAITQASAMVHSIRANKTGFLAGDYNNPSAAQHSTCLSSGCSAHDMAEQDYYEWENENANLLPLGTGTVATSGTNATVTVNWSEYGTTKTTALEARIN